ncbi:F-box/WD-40 repeat-containing protein [Striga asiatica]|uniref:F-box/WD-40 repeat-containing protein n=1 Tax=Striga asiatica TaxID=4170 RepID=A0A5A7PFQ4_STRAF|nr:F-box/WD-40 repeat-containing protein [Striga asiatica]
MAFECQKDTEDNLRNTSTNHLDSSQAGKAVSDQLNLTSNRKLEPLESENLQGAFSKLGIHSTDLFLKSSRSFTDLPPALVSEILNFLDPKELGTISCVNTSLYKLASEHHVWKEFYRERWGHPVNSIGLGQDDKSWKELFVERDFRSKTIYSGSWDMTVRLWDRASLKCLKVLMHNDWVWSLVPHETTIGSTAGSSVHIWETNTGNQLAVINGAHGGNVYSLARSHTGKLLFSGGEDGSIHMFEITGNFECARKIATWIPHTGPVHSLAFEFPWLVSASSDGRISLIDVRGLLKTKKRFSTENADSKVM